jgi:hypothetical protein
MRPPIDGGTILIRGRPRAPHASLPGPVDTEFNEIAGMVGGSEAVPQFVRISAEKCAREWTMREKAGSASREEQAGLAPREERAAQAAREVRAETQATTSPPRSAGK